MRTARPFKEYANKLDSLQRLMKREQYRRLPGGNNYAFEVEKARVAHNSARDRLASELMRSIRAARRWDGRTTCQKNRSAAVEIGRVSRGDAAERDWRQAERLVRTAASCAG